jgi:hypothetical protein
MSLASVALDTQMDLLRWTRSDMGRRYSNIVCEPWLDERHERDPDDPGADFGARLHRTVLTAAETYAVAEEICDALDSARQLIPNFPLHDTDLPSSGGFVWFEKKIIIDDSFGKKLSVKAFAWHRARPVPDDEWDVSFHEAPLGFEDTGTEGRGPKGIIILLWTDPSDPTDHMHQEWLDTHDLPGYSNVAWPNLWSMGGGTWDYGTSPKSDVDRLIFAFLRFVAEPWVDSRVTVAERHAVKRARRLVPVEPQIKVVRLRRSEKTSKAHRDPDAEPIEWSHRWIVRTHVRKQWYPSLGRHKLRIIPEHIKGPVDKPLVVHDKIFVVDR